MKFHEGEIDFITLGCSKNLVDAERVMRQLEAAGWRCVHDAEDPQGEICVINTCGFIGDAKEESVNMILQMAERKKEKKLRKLIVMGCLSERYRAELEAELPEVDEYFGKFDFENLTLSLPPREGTDGGCHPAKQKKSEGGCASYERKLTTPKHYAYLKISEGCNRMCSYCAIPLITGRHTSRPKEDILDEVRWLVSQGVKELNVIAQDLSSYGLDLKPHPALPSREGDKSGVRGKHLLPELVDEIAQVPGVEWIRLHYAYPTDFPEGLLDVIQTSECMQISGYRFTTLHRPYAGSDAETYNTGRTGRADQEDTRESAGNLHPHDIISRPSRRERGGF